MLCTAAFWWWMLAERQHSVCRSSTNFCSACEGRHTDVLRCRNGFLLPFSPFQGFLFDFCVLRTLACCFLFCHFSMIISSSALSVLGCVFASGRNRPPRCHWESFIERCVFVLAVAATSGRTALQADYENSETLRVRWEEACGAYCLHISTADEPSTCFHSNYT